MHIDTGDASPTLENNMNAVCLNTLHSTTTDKGKNLHSSSQQSLQALAEPSTVRQALAQPSITTQASAVPSTQGTVTSSSKPKLIFKPSNSADRNVSTDFSPAIIQKQSEIISTVWPTTTTHARQMFPDFCERYENVRAYALPNFLGAQLPIPSALNLNSWTKKLSDYHDKGICQFLQYGWPVGYHLQSPPSSAETNHPSANAHPTHIEKFISTEISHGAMVGPFTSPPFTPWTRCSPLMTRPKKDSTDRRVIIDLSYPHGQAVNDGINTENFFGKDISYSLPTIGDLVAIIQHHGRGSYLWKADLARAYRQFRIDPLDTPLLAIKFRNNYYLDLCPSFGCRTSSAACQRVSNALVYILAKEGHTVLAYLDDYASCHSSLAKAQEGFDNFISTAKELGLDLAIHKCVQPTNKIEWLGYSIDSNKMEVSIPVTKMQDFVKECSTWLSKRKASKRAIQSLIGRMNFIANCVTQARRFMSRILAALRAMGDREWTTLSDGFRLDIKWFVAYATRGNGVALITPSRHRAYIECDSSLTGGGGVGNEFCYTWEYTPGHVRKFPNIHELEAVNIIVAFRTLAHRVAPPGAHITIYTDNSSSAYALETGRTRDKTLGACARELWLLAAFSDQVVDISHKPGELIPVSDALSRMHNDCAKKEYALNRIKQDNLCLVSPHVHNYKFFDVGL